MIARELVWTRDPHDARIRLARFERRVPFERTLAISLARALQARATEIFSATISVDILPPTLLEARVWSQLCNDALAYEMSADCGDLTVLIAREAARTIVANAFGESSVTRGEDELSPVEHRVFERFVGELTEGLSAVRGSCKGAAVRSRTPSQRDAYCELRFGTPLDVAIGFAVREKPVRVGPTIAPGVLEECPLECSAQVVVDVFDIFTIAGLAPGDVLPLRTKVGPYATLNVGPDPIAAGEGGVLGDRTAFKVHELI